MTDPGMPIDCGELPEVVRCGPFDYLVTDKPEDWEHYGPGGKHTMWGYTNNERGLILIHPNTTCAMRRAVLMHEMMHAALFASGHVYNKRRKEESWVLLVAPMLLDALQRSPGLARWLGVP